MRDIAGLTERARWLRLQIWDMVMRQDKEVGGGEIYFDNKLIRKDGRFVIPELQGLNPENLQ